MLLHSFCAGTRRPFAAALAAMALAALLLPAASALAAPPRVLVYGDSNSWGWEAVASGFPTQRHAASERWPEVMRRGLGAHAEVVVDALPGRTVDIDHVGPVGRLAADAFNGLRGIAPVVAGELPLELVVVMLGTNDLASDQNRSPQQIAAGMAALVRTIRDIEGGVLTTYPAPRVLVVAPPPLGEVSRTPLRARFDAGSRRKSIALAAAYREALSGIEGVSVVDAGDTVGPLDGIDGIHLSGAQQRILGTALAARVESELSITHPEEFDENPLVGP